MQVQFNVQKAANPKAMKLPTGQAGQDPSEKVIFLSPPFFF